MKFSYWFFISLILGIPFTLLGQPLLTPEMALSIVKEKSFSLTINHARVDMATLTRQSGLGPFLPLFSASSTQAGKLSHPTFRKPELALNANLNLFDGFSSYHAYQGLKSQEKAAQAQEQTELEKTLVSVLEIYFDIVKQKCRLGALYDLLFVSESRAKLAQAKMELGAGSKLEQLQSLADLNADSSAYLAQEVSLNEAKMKLNLLMNSIPTTVFEVLDSIPLEDSLPLQQWKDSLLFNNPSIKKIRFDYESSKHNLKQAQGNRLPDLDAGFSYVLNPALSSMNSTGSSGTNPNAVNYSLKLTLPLFDRLQAHKEIGLARLQIRQSLYEIQLLENEIQGEFEMAAQRYRTGKRQIQLEEKNLEVTRLQVEAALERYRVGSTSPLEFRDAQRKRLDAQSRLIDARYGTKSAELTLQRLAGILSLTAAR